MPRAPSASSARSRSTTTAGSVRAAAAAARPPARDHAPRPRRHHDDAVAEHDRLLDVVGHEHDRARLRRQRVREPALHLLARERVERRERLVEREHRLPASSVRRNATRWRIPPDSSAGARPRSRRGRSARTTACAARAPASRATPRTRSASAALSSALSPRQQQVALGHQHRRVGRDGARVGRLQPADQLQQRRLAAAARADDRDDLARRGAQVHPAQRDDLGAATAAEAAPLRRPVRCPCSLRGHYPTGSKGQRRVIVQGAISAGSPPAPLDLHCWRRDASARAGRPATLASAP